MAYQESVSDHLLDWQPMKSGSSPPGETPCVTVCLLRRTVFFFHWQSMTLTLSVSGLCRTGLKNNQFNYEGIFVFCFRKKRRRRKRTLPSRVTSVFLGPRAMNHSCNVSWQFWSEADWAGEFQNKQKKKKRLRQLPQTHMATRRAWQHLSVCWQSRKVATSFLVPSMSNTETDSTLWKIFP